MSSTLKVAGASESGVTADDEFTYVVLEIPKSAASPEEVASLSAEDFDLQVLQTVDYPSCIFFSC